MIRGRLKPRERADRFERFELLALEARLCRALSRVQGTSNMTQKPEKTMRFERRCIKEWGKMMDRLELMTEAAA